MQSAIAPKVNINRRTLQAVLRVNPGLAGGRSAAEFKDYLENGGSFALNQEAAANNLPTPSQQKAEAEADRVAFEQALGFFVRTQTNEAAATLEELQAQKAQIEAAMEQTARHAEAKLKSFVNMLDPMNVAQFGNRALQAHASELQAVGINPSNILI